MDLYLSTLDRIQQLPAPALTGTNTGLLYYTAKYIRINRYLKLQRCTEYSKYQLHHLPVIIPDFTTTAAETHIFTGWITAPNAVKTMTRD